jgi:hypothetical protein
LINLIGISENDVNFPDAIKVAINEKLFGRIFESVPRIKSKYSSIFLVGIVL